MYVGPGAVVERGSRLGSLAVLGAGARLEEGGIVENAIVGARTSVGAGASVMGSIVGDEAELGAGSELHNLSVVGPGARVGAGTCSTTGCASAQGSASPTRPCASRESLRPRARKVEKPWGWELVWAEAEDYVGKLLFVRAGESLSLQYHEVKDESWLCRRVARGSSSERSADARDVRYRAR